MEYWERAAREESVTDKQVGREAHVCLFLEVQSERRPGWRGMRVWLKWIRVHQGGGLCICFPAFLLTALVLAAWKEWGAGTFGSISPAEAESWPGQAKGESLKVEVTDDESGVLCLCEFSQQLKQQSHPPDTWTVYDLGSTVCGPRAPLTDPPLFCTGGLKWRGFRSCSSVNGPSRCCLVSSKFLSTCSHSSCLPTSCFPVVSRPIALLSACPDPGLCQHRDRAVGWKTRQPRWLELCAK